MNPTGVAVLDTDTTGHMTMLEFIDHPAREWVDLQVKAEGVMDAIRNRDFKDQIVRLSIEATGPEYSNLDIKAIRELARPALEFQIRREGTAEAFSFNDTPDTQTYSLMEAWEQHVKTSVARKWAQRVLETGNQALSRAGVVDA
jgi:hypothetical protein